MSTDFLTDLAAIDDDRPLPVETIQLRARTIRRHRRARGGLVAGGVAAALVVGVAVLPQAFADRPDGLLGVAQAGGEDRCNGGSGDDVARGSWPKTPDAARFASVIASADLPPVRTASLGEGTNNCADNPPVAVLYSAAPAVRGVTIWADVPNPYEGQDGIVDRQVRGTGGRLLTLSDGERVLSWSEDDERWYAEASGVDDAQLIATLDALELVDGRLDPASVPTGWSAAAVPVARESRTARTWSVVYGTGAERVQLMVSQQHQSPVEVASRAAALTTITTVDGHLAAYTSNGQLWWNADGLGYVLNGSGGLDRLRQLAGSVEHIGLDDPRIATAPAVDATDRGY